MLSCSKLYLHRARDNVSGAFCLFGHFVDTYLLLLGCIVSAYAHCTCSTAHSAHVRAMYGRIESTLIICVEALTTGECTFLESYLTLA